MAKVTISIEDTSNNSMHVSDPPFPGPAAKDQNMSLAQSVATQILAALYEDVADEGGDVRRQEASNDVR